MISLGINYNRMHDSSACIVRDGELLFAVAEERLSRLKHDASFPARAIRACLNVANVHASELDEVCFGWSAPRTAYIHDLRCFAIGKEPLTYLDFLNSTRLFLNMWHQRGGQNPFHRHFPDTRARFRFVDHHLAHAISAYAYSGFNEAAILVIDGRGAWEATSIWRGRNGTIEQLETIQWPNSLGMFYAQFTNYLGFQPWSDEWKVMGLAPYGEPGMDLRDFVTIEDDSYSVNIRRLMGRNSSPVGGIEQKLGPRREPECEITDRHKNVAFAVQDTCEQVMLMLAQQAVEKAGVRDLCMAGGVALNSKANGKILGSGKVNHLFVQPAASDDGVCLGAALAPYLDNRGRLPLREMRSAYLGPEFSADEIEGVLRTYKLRYTRSNAVTYCAAELLAAGKILGWFQGRMEFGPRALGSRSILADPRDPEMTVRVNSAVKFREWWRPFAPSLLAESAGEYLKSAEDSPFMVLTSQVRTEKRSQIPAVTHVDGSARPQTVEQNVNPLYWQVIRHFGDRTGVPVVLNTSFNLRGEPIVCNPTDAIRTYFSSGMDALVIGQFIVEK
ncbi:MAG TPA: carbamoyltransferase C-terminal domain-containing protein [Candidatus Acidoferrales bacterium]|nr:carbamoyltransferase C-terminal domain-containing protein [Candidatus Acidoferrales bacterium]